MTTSQTLQPQNNQPEIKKNVKVFFKNTLLHHSFLMEAYEKKRNSFLVFIKNFCTDSKSITEYFDKTNQTTIKFIQPIKN